MRKKPITNDHITRLAKYGIQDIPAATCCQYFRPGEAINREGLPVQFFFVVMTGQAKVCLTTVSGRNLVLCYYVSEGVIGDVELVTDNYTATATIIAVTDFECIAIPYCQNAEILKQNISFMNLIGGELAKKLLLSTNNFLSAALCTGEERLCSYILNGSQNNIFNDILTDAARSVGLSYRHVLRILNQLCIDGLLEKRESGYRIVDREKLCQKAINANGKY